MRLTVVVQHHPSRGHLLGGLTTLGDHAVVRDPDPDGKPSALRTYVECLRAIPDETTHLAIVQDDAEPHPRFRERAEHAVAERSSDLLAFFVPRLGAPGKFVRDAAREGRGWAQLPRSVNWTPTVALCWPRDLAERFLPFAEEWIERRTRRGLSTVGDDPVVGAFVRRNAIPVWATVPCLVQHPDVGYSLVKLRDYKGTNPARQAAVWDGQ